MNIRRTVKKIQKADRVTIDAVLNAALIRKMELYPEWEIIYLALSRDDKEKRQEAVHAVLGTMLEKK